jgi:hypothetical protein
MDDFHKKLEELEKKVNQQRFALLVLTLILVPTLTFFEFAAIRLDKMLLPPQIRLRAKNGSPDTCITPDHLSFWHSHHLNYGGFRTINHVAFDLRNRDGSVYLSPSGFLLGPEYGGNGQTQPKEIDFYIGSRQPESHLWIIEQLSAYIILGVMQDCRSHIPELHLEKDDGGSIKMKLTEDGEPKYEFRDKAGTVIFGEEFEKCDCCRKKNTS